MDTQNPKASHRENRREAGVIQRIRASLRRSWIQPSAPLVLIACSGGRDSVVLAHMLQALQRTDSIRAALVHVDHQVRDDSAEAADLVTSIGDSFHMPVHIVQLAPEVIAGHAGAGAEESLRRERYRAFADVAGKTGANIVALAHHQRDQAETMLLHLIRGSGLHGASGMREYSRIEVPWWENPLTSASIRLWRPLLNEPLSLLDDWQRMHGLPVAEDSTNEERLYRRNALRHDVLPELETIFPGAVANLARFSSLAAEDDDYLERQAAMHTPVSLDGDLPRDTIVHKDVAIQRRIVRQWMLRSNYPGDLTSDRIDAVRDLAGRNRTRASVDIGSGWTVVMRGGVLSLRSPMQVP